MVSKKTINEVVRRLVEGFNPNRIILFGSYARGTAHAKSDVDFLVICPFRKDRKAMMIAMDHTLRGLAIPRDIVLLTPEEFEAEKDIPGTVARYATKEGRPLYEHT